MRKIIRYGQFYRHSDARLIQRFRCDICKRGFSQATADPCYLQNKRQFNFRIYQLLCSGVSQRRAAWILNLNRKTIVRKFIFLAEQAKLSLEAMNLAFHPATEMQFDDVETFEHTKCKPLSITLAVESGTRRILGFRVSQIAAKGPLAAIAFKKYGPRESTRSQARQDLFAELRNLVSETAVIKSDQDPHYPPDVKLFFPKGEHLNFKGRKGAVTGQGELKKIGFDPIFSLNHTAAMLRANMNRLFRRTWCTTKKPERLACHLMLYSVFHNEMLLEKALSKAN